MNQQHIDYATKTVQAFCSKKKLDKKTSQEFKSYFILYIIQSEQKIISKEISYKTYIDRKVYWQYPEFLNQITGVKRHYAKYGKAYADIKQNNPELNQDQIQKLFKKKYSGANPKIFNKTLIVSNPQVLKDSNGDCSSLQVGDKRDRFKQVQDRQQVQVLLSKCGEWETRIGGLIMAGFSKNEICENLNITPKFYAKVLFQMRKKFKKER